ISLRSRAVPNPRSAEGGHPVSDPEIVPRLNGQSPWLKFGMPVGVALLFLLLWDLSVRLLGSDLFPKPIDVLRGIAEVIGKGLLLKDVVASLFRVTVGFGLAVLLGIPRGLLLGWFQRLFFAFNPMIQVLRP